MPIYVYACPKLHNFEVYRERKAHKPVERCPKHRSASHQVFLPTEVAGGMISEGTRKLLTTPLGRKNMAGVRTVGDVDRVLQKIEGNYSHMATGLGRNTAGYPKITKTVQDQ